MKSCRGQYKAFIKALHRRAKVLLVCFSLCLLSCVSGRSGYPENWSPRAESETMDYSGRYNAALIPLLSVEPLSKKDSTECVYDFIINAWEIKYRRDCPHTTDRDYTDYIPISSANFDLELKQKREGLQIVYKPHTIADNPVAGYQKEYMLLSKARDNSLIVEKVGKVYGLAFLIFPVAASEHRWYRFYDGKVEILDGMMD